MNATLRIAMPLVVLSVAIFAANAPALAAHRTISIGNESPKEIHMQVISEGPHGAQNVWTGMLDKPLGARPNSTAADFEDYGQSFRIIFSGPGCDVAKVIEPNELVHSVIFKNCAISVR